MSEISLSEARRCVRCAVCLPHCPTYAVTRDEAESPRGRLALMDGWARGRLVSDEDFWAHLDRCLGCRLCESVCPAEVPYGALLDTLRAKERLQGRRVPWIHRFLRGMATHPARLTAARPLLQTIVAVRRRWRMPGLPSSLKQLLELIPDPVPRPWRPERRALSRYPRHGEVALFLGCYARLLRPQPLRATVRVLETLGVDVVVPPGQVCCGALARHQGEASISESLARKNRQVFREADMVIALDTGCLGSLRESLEEGTQQCQVVDVCRFLERLPAIERRVRANAVTGLPPLAIHTPCTQRSLAGDAASVLHLLERLGVTATPWGQGAGCCGAAGSYALIQPDMAARLEERIAQEPLAPDVQIVTTNIGCALAIGALTRRRGDPRKILHPIEIIDEIMNGP